MFPSILLTASLLLPQERTEGALEIQELGPADAPSVLARLLDARGYRYDLNATYAQALLGPLEGEEGSQSGEEDTIVRNVPHRVSAKAQVQKDKPAHLRAGSCEVYCVADTLAFQVPDQDWTAIPRQARNRSSEDGTPAPEVLALCATPSPHELVARLPVRTVAWTCPDDEQEDLDPERDRQWVASLMPRELAQWPGFQDFEPAVERATLEVWTTADGHLRSIVLSGWARPEEIEEHVGSTENGSVEDGTKQPPRPAFRIVYELRDIDAEVKVDVPAEAQQLLNFRG